MQPSSGRAMTGYGGGGLPDLYAGFGGGPFALISRLSDEMDRLFESFGMGGGWPSRSAATQRGTASQGAGSQGMRSLWAPHIEVAERDGKILVQADLPGVRKEDVNVQLEDDAIVIHGQRHQEAERNEQGFYHSERSYGTFYRMIPLPDGVDVEQASASFRDGVLRIEVPVPQQRPRGRKLEIRDDSKAPGQIGQSPTGAQSGTSAPAGTSQGMQGQYGASSGAAAGQQAAGQAAQGTVQPGSPERR